MGNVLVAGAVGNRKARVETPDQNGNPCLIDPVVLVDAYGNPAAGGTATFFTDTVTPLGSGATFTGAAHDVGVAPGTTTASVFYTATFYSDQGGTAYIDGSIDGATWYPVTSAALVGATPLTLQAPVTMRTWRSRLINGATAQTACRVTSAFSGA
jgi:hypothetical protein